MDTYLKKSLLICLVLIPNLIWSQNDSIDYYKEKASEIGLKGYTNHSDGNYVKALDDFKQYLFYRIKAYGNSDYMLGRPYMYIGITYKSMGQNNLALESYRKAEEYFRLRGDNTNSLGGLYLNIGNVYRAKLDYKNALKYFEQGLNKISKQLSK